MTTIEIVVLAIVQGLTEFLPISSSGHLVLVPFLVDWTDQGLAFDVAVHFGSLLAVVVFFREDIAGLLRGALQLVSGDRQSPQAYMALAIALGTVPAAAAGLLFASWIEANLRDPSIIVYTLAGYGILMALADRYARRTRVIEATSPWPCPETARANKNRRCWRSTATTPTNWKKRSSRCIAGGYRRTILKRCYKIPMGSVYRPEQSVPSPTKCGPWSSSGKTAPWLACIRSSIWMLCTSN